MTKKTESLYPIYYNGMLWGKSEVSDVFDTYYHSRAQLMDDGGVYVTDGIVVYPDDEDEEEDE